MRKLAIYRNNIFAGTLTEEDRESFVFEYDDRYFNDVKMPAISLAMPKTTRKYRSDTLFPFFYNMLSEGVNRKLQRRFLRIDENDFFGLLGATARFDTIGAVTVKPIDV